MALSKMNPFQMAELEWQYHVIIALAIVPYRWAIAAPDGGHQIPQLQVPSTASSSSSSSSSSPTQSTTSWIPHPEKSECGIFFAPSTIPGAGLGVYAGRDYEPEENFSHGDITVPLVEMAWHVDSDNFTFLWHEYTWSAGSFPGMDEEGEEVNGASFGMGAAPNCFFPGINVEDTYSGLDSAGLHRSRDPGAGAFTPYHDRSSFATKFIGAGSEVFVDYGESYFTSRQELFGPLPGHADIDAADSLVAKFNELSSTGLLGPEPTTTSAGVDLLQSVKNMLSTWSTRAMSSKLVLDVLNNTGHTEDGRVTYTYNNSRSVEWLREHGTCMDNIYPDRSTLSQAGRGAFATRFIREGHVVAPVPLIHLPDRSVLNMYNGYYKEDGGHVRLLRNESDPIHSQLLLNYCFGHQESSLLLCPYGMLTSLINHWRERANIEIVWSDKLTRHPEWFHQPIEKWGDTMHAGLTFEYVATRDIRPGEEIFVDYGQEWSKAWRRHVKDWKPPPGASSYFPAYELESDADLVIPTSSEGGYYSREAIRVWCYDVYREMSGLKRHPHEEYHYCEPVRRYERDGELRYDAEIYTESDDGWVCAKNFVEVVWDIPRDAFSFEDLFYSRDHAQTWSFRHEMMIPDHLMPDVWRNKRGL